MSETIEQSAPATGTSELHPKIEEMLARIGREAEPERGETLKTFARALLRRLAEDDLEGITSDELYALATSAFAFAESRGLEASAVRVFNADPDTHGYRCHGTVIEVVTDDSPFLVDSISEELTARGLTIKRLLHPVIGADRDEQGHLVGVRSGREAEHRESFMHFEVDRALGDEVTAELEERVRRILRDVSLVVRDFDPMQERVRHMIELARAAEVSYPPEVVEEVAKFLDWLLQLNFVLLGYREYELLDTKEGRAIRAVPGSGLGILSNVEKSTFSELTLLSDLTPDVRNRIEDGELLIYSKTQAYSTVHRRARMDYIGVRKVAPDGSIVGEARLIGLFTSKAYMEPAAKTPLLHHKLEQLIAAEDLIPGSHDYKAVVALFESFPKDELFQASAEELRRLVAGLLQLEKHGGIRVLIRRDLYGRNVSVVVALPRDRFNADLRKRLQGLFLERFHGTTIDYHLSLGETESARIFFTIHVAPGIPIPDVRYEELEQEVERLARTWEDDLLDALTRRVGAGRAIALMEEYAPRFPDYYKANDDWDLVVDDVVMLEKLEASTEGFLVGLGNESKGERLTRVKLYKTGGKVDLSDFMPILEALGLRVVEEVPTAIEGEGRVYIHDFGVLDSRGAVLELGEAADRVTDTIAAVWRGSCDSDSLNRLVTLSSLTWWEVRILRALRNYRMRVSARYTENYRNDAMAAYPSISERLVRMFEARFDPVRAASDGGDRRDPPGDPPGSSGRRLPRPGQHPATPARDDRGDRADERVRARSVLPELQARVGARAGDAQAHAALRDLGLLDGDGGDPPPSGDGLPRRDPLVGPAGGLPHGGPRPDEGAEGEERRHRSRRVQGWLRAQADVGRARAAQGRGREAVRHLHGGSPGHHRQPRQGGGRAPGRGSGDGRPGSRISWSPRTRAPRRSRIPRTASVNATATGSATPSPPEVRTGTTTRCSASPPAASGSR